LERLIVESGCSSTGSGSLWREAEEIDDFDAAMGSASAWSTPHANTGTGAGTAGRDGGPNIQSQAGAWATATATDHKGSAKPGQRRGQLSEVETWPTATAGDAKDSGSAGYSTEERSDGTTLTDAAARGRRWLTPILGEAHLSSTPEAAQRRMDEGKETLSRTVEAASLSPSRPDPAIAPPGDASSPTTPDSLPLSRLRLSPVFVEWLMGFPRFYTDPDRW